MLDGKKIFVTGATGFLGSQYVASLLSRYSCEVYCLVRPVRGAEGMDRLTSTKALKEVPKLRGTLVPIAGDIRKEGLGLMSALYSELAKKIDYVIHIAANVNFLATMESLRAINTWGTRNVLSFAKVCASENVGFKHFMLVSSAYVAGATNRKVPESIQFKPPHFRNQYEKSKWEAELLVVREHEGIPYSIVRPSTIVGNSKTGRADRSNVLFAPLSESLRHKHESLFVMCALDGRLDVVSVDYVADCMIAILCDPPPTGTVFHLTSGLDNQQPIRNLFRIIRNVFHIRLIPLPFWTFRFIFKPLMKWRNSKEDVRLLRIADAYLGYLGYGPKFDTTNIDAIIQSNGIIRPTSSKLVETVLLYAKETNFAKE